MLREEFKGRTTAEEIHAHMKSKVAKHKQLVGGIEFVDEVPKLQSGKIMRKIVKEWAKKDAEKMRGRDRAKL
jgi:4-coumarate--CoA ligase